MTNRIGRATIVARTLRGRGVSGLEGEGGGMDGMDGG